MQQRKKQIKQNWKSATYQKIKRKQKGNSNHSEQLKLSSSHNGQMKVEKMKQKKKLPSLIDEKQKHYIQKIANKSQHNEVRIAIKQTNDGIYNLVLGPYLQQSQIRKQIKKRKNGQLVSQNFERKTQVLFLQDQLLKYQLNFDQKARQKFSNSLKIIKQLYLDANFIDNIAFVKFMPNLRAIHLNFNFIQSMQPIKQLNLLTQLMLIYNKIQTIESLQEKKHLIDLNLNHNKIQVLQNMGDLNNLETLQIADNMIYQIKGLQGLYNLIKLDLSFNQITKIEGFQNIQKLQQVDLSYNNIYQIVNLDKCVNLKKLCLNRNFIQKLQNLENCTNLKILQLHCNDITVIQNLSNLGQLTMLSLSHNRITKIQGLQNKPNLYLLNLSDNQIVSLEDLMEMGSHLISLNIIDLSGNGIQELNSQVFDFLFKLRYLYISENPFKNTLVLRKVAKKLSEKYQGFYLNLDEEIELQNNQFEDFQADI